MRNTRWIAAACALLGLVDPAAAETVAAGGGGMVMSRNCDGFMTEVPVGWILDNHAGIGAGIDMLFYPEGTQDPGHRRVPMYAYVMPTVRGSDEVSVQWLARSALDDYRKDDPQARLQPLELPLHPRKGLKATAYTLTAPGIHKYEAIAYVENDRVIFAVTLTADTAEALASNLSFVGNVVDAGVVVEPGGECMARRSSQ